MTRKAGFTLVEIMIVVAIIGLLAAIAIPNFIKARQSSQRAACINNLRTIDGAKATWALENKKKSGDPVGDDDIFGETKFIKVKPDCPAGGAYDIGAVDAKPDCDAPGHDLP